MAIAVSYGGDDEFRAFLYGSDRHPNTIDYLETNINRMSNILTNAGASFMSNVHAIQDQFIGSDALRLARAAVAKVSNIFQTDCIREIYELTQFQNAPLSLQRYVMAQPYVRQMYIDQKCNGYESTYVDMYPGTIADTHYDYRRAMHGMVTIDESGLEKTTFYLDDLVEGDRELYLDEKVIIENVWSHVSSLMQYGERDPTSQWNESL